MFLHQYLSSFTETQNSNAVPLLQDFASRNECQNFEDRIATKGNVDNITLLQYDTFGFCPNQQTMGVFKLNRNES